MLAAHLVGHGGNEVVVAGPYPKPVRRHGEVMVRARAAAINRVGLHVHDSGAGMTHRLPQVMGLGGAGIVESADGEPLLRVGQPLVSYPGASSVRRGASVLCRRTC